MLAALYHSQRFAPHRHVKQRRHNAITGAFCKRLDEGAKKFRVTESMRIATDYSRQPLAGKVGLVECTDHREALIDQVA